MDWYEEKCAENGQDPERRKEYEINLAWIVYWLLKRGAVILFFVLIGAALGVW